MPNVHCSLGLWFMLGCHLSGGPKWLPDTVPVVAGSLVGCVSLTHGYWRSSVTFLTHFPISQPHQHSMCRDDRKEWYMQMWHFNAYHFFQILYKNVKLSGTWVWERPFLELKRIMSWFSCWFLVTFPSTLMFIAQILLPRPMEDSQVRRHIPTLGESTIQLGEIVCN